MTMSRSLQSWYKESQDQKCVEVDRRSLKSRMSQSNTISFAQSTASSRSRRVSSVSKKKHENKVKSSKSSQPETKLTNCNDPNESTTRSIRLANFPIYGNPSSSSGSRMGNPRPSSSLSECTISSHVHLRRPAKKIASCSELMSPQSVGLLPDEKCFAESSYFGCGPYRTFSSMSDCQLQQKWSCKSTVINRNSDLGKSSGNSSFTSTYEDETFLNSTLDGSHLDLSTPPSNVHIESIPNYNNSTTSRMMPRGLKHEISGDQGDIKIDSHLDVARLMTNATHVLWSLAPHEGVQVLDKPVRKIIHDTVCEILQSSIPFALESGNHGNGPSLLSPVVPPHETSPGFVEVTQKACQSTKTHSTTAPSTNPQSPTVSDPATTDSSPLIQQNRWPDQCFSKLGETGMERLTFDDFGASTAAGGLSPVSPPHYSQTALCEVLTRDYQRQALSSAEEECTFSERKVCCRQNQHQMCQRKNLENFYSQDMQNYFLNLESPQFPTVKEEILCGIPPSHVGVASSQKKNDFSSQTTNDLLTFKSTKVVDFFYAPTSYTANSASTLSMYRATDIHIHSSDRRNHPSMTIEKLNSISISLNNLLRATPQKIKLSIRKSPSGIIHKAPTTSDNFNNLAKISIAPKCNQREENCNARSSFVRPHATLRHNKCATSIHLQPEFGPPFDKSCTQQRACSSKSIVGVFSARLKPFLTRLSSLLSPIQKLQKNIPILSVSEFYFHHHVKSFQPILSVLIDNFFSYTNLIIGFVLSKAA